ncbi:MAG: hypothetical protein Q8O86_05745 [Dehalococcoidia bacterium]|nr:hypothetical protein [Dehalococcoidia bacterium]
MQRKCNFDAIQGNYLLEHDSGDGMTLAQQNRGVQRPYVRLVSGQRVQD